MRLSRTSNRGGTAACLCLILITLLLAYRDMVQRVYDLGVEQSLWITEEDPFTPTNINTIRPSRCGWEKCFFRIRSNETVAFLVAKWRKNRLESLEAGYQLAKQLERDYDIEHFYLSPPFKTTITSGLQETLNQNLWSEKNQRAHIEGYIRFRKGAPAFVQKVKVAPEPNLLLGCVEAKVDAFEQKIDKFLTKVHDKELFGRRFADSLDQARALLNVEPCLTKDFQALIDTRGHLFHLDFDRCFSVDDGTSTKKITDPADLAIEDCAHALDRIEQRVERAVNDHVASVRANTIGLGWWQA